ncbi:MAG: hypothetical protein LZF62_40021 [Nitrospira sp.]|nr:MAG: hypothetical protein LZF62_40021 [Nitrospira sp.]
MSSRPQTPSEFQDVRCVCGRLTARLEKRGVVVKCHRCGEFVVISLADLKAQLNRATP